MILPEWYSVCRLTCGSLFPRTVDHVGYSLSRPDSAALRLSNSQRSTGSSICARLRRVPGTARGQCRMAWLKNASLARHLRCRLLLPNSRIPKVYITAPVPTRSVRSQTPTQAYQSPIGSHPRTQPTAPGPIRQRTWLRVSRSPLCMPRRSKRDLVNC